MLVVPYYNKPSQEGMKNGSFISTRNND
ncbi:hypothetical protein CGLO_12458 [Colletotrichum gloeosporioides Cg-14]|uniref:Uncharacterized protein n=1 Tax=Colletotrichum gloeosporioides (strain Cg-14) TaxID=1237896 RepID=T0LJG1_COLGC|nr:hypothetical protein CGLO_12458 [Colletotrichum gloeosporioides Cg-14]